MSVEISTNESVEVSEPKTIVADKIRVVTTLNNFEDGNTFAMALVKFGTMVDGEFKELKQEAWFLQGEFYDQNKGPEVTGKLDVVFRQGCANLINAIQNTPNLKQSLIDSGQLKISEGSIMNLMSKI